MLEDAEIQNIDDRKFYFRILLENGDGDVLNISKSAVTHLVLVDNLLSPFLEGHIVIRNDNDILDRSGMYKFRGDARDVLYIGISPDLGEGAQELEAFHKINLSFAIYSEENIFTDNGKYKRFYFRDTDEQMLRENSIGYVSSTNTNKVQLQRLTNEQRAEKTGDVIKGILNLALNGTNPKFDETWDEGSGKIFYASPASTKAWVDLNYVLNHHVSAVSNDACILRKERDDHLYSLTSLAAYFHNAVKKDGTAGRAMQDRYIISSSSDDVSINTKQNDKMDAMYLPDLNTIGQYEFLHCEADDVQKHLASRVVVNHDGEYFNIDGDGLYSVTSKAFDTLYTNGITKRGEGAYTSTTSKLANINLNVVATPHSEKKVRISHGFASVLRDYVFLNQALQFTVKGSTHRRSGRFIQIDNQSGKEQDTLDPQLLGSHFVVNTVHEFVDNTYTNTITCVKTYRNIPLKFKSDV